MKIIAKYADKKYLPEWYCPYCKFPLYYLYNEKNFTIGLGLDTHFQCSNSKCKRVFKKGIHGFHETDLDLTKIETKNE